MAKKNNFRDPRGHSLRIYSDVYDSAAFAALSPYDVMAYLALLRELKQYNNGDLSLPLSRAKLCGIKHHITLARSLRALCAVGLIARTRKGGSNPSGQRLPSLYRVTDRECYDIPAKHIEASPASNEWKRVTSVEHGHKLIAEAERQAEVESADQSAAIKSSLEKKALRHGVAVTRTRRDMKSTQTKTRRDTCVSRPGRGVTMAENTANPLVSRAAGIFVVDANNAVHRIRHVPPLHIASPASGGDDDLCGDGTAIEMLSDLWASVGCRSNWKQKALPNFGSAVTRRTAKNQRNTTGLMAA